LYDGDAGAVCIQMLLNPQNCGVQPLFIGS